MCVYVLIYIYEYFPSKCSKYTNKVCLYNIEKKEEIDRKLKTQIHTHSLLDQVYLAHGEILSCKILSDSAWQQSVHRLRAMPFLSAHVFRSALVFSRHSNAAHRIRVIGFIASSRHAATSAAGEVVVHHIAAPHRSRRAVVLETPHDIDRLGEVVIVLSQQAKSLSVDAIVALAVDRTSSAV